MAEDMTMAQGQAGSAFDIDRALDDFLGGIGPDRADAGGSVTFQGQDPSYHVRVNLTRCAMWFMSLGMFDRDAIEAEGEAHQLLPPDTITANTPYGELVRLAPPVRFSETNGYWADPVLTVRGSCRPEWQN